MLTQSLLKGRLPILLMCFALCPSHHDTLDGDIGSSRDQVAIDEGLIHRLSRPTANAGPAPSRHAGPDGGGPG